MSKKQQCNVIGCTLISMQLFKIRDEPSDISVEKHNFVMVHLISTA